MTTATLSDYKQQTINECIGEAFDLACPAIRKLGDKSCNAYDGSLTGYYVWDCMATYVDPEWAVSVDGHSGGYDDGCEGSPEAKLCHAFIALALANAKERTGCDDETIYAEVKAWLLCLKETLDTDFKG